jgi:aryl-phospho-beta-D-glucosidase BglC (GH1 family)
MLVHANNSAVVRGNWHWENDVTSVHNMYWTENTKNGTCALFVVLSLLPASAFASDSQSSPAMRGVMSPTKFVASDFQALGKYNVNLIRWQIMRNWGQAATERDLTDYDDWLAGKLNELDLVLLAAKENDLKVVIDLHTPPEAAIQITPWPCFMRKYTMIASSKFGVRSLRDTMATQLSGLTISLMSRRKIKLIRLQV